MMSIPYPVATVIEPSRVEIGSPVQPLILAPDRSTALLMNMAADRRAMNNGELNNNEKVPAKLQSVDTSITDDHPGTRPR